jgi:hypothetical protein
MDLEGMECDFFPIPISGNKHYVTYSIDKEYFRRKFKDVLENDPAESIDDLTDALLKCFDEENK